MSVEPNVGGVEDGGWREGVVGVADMVAEVEVAVVGAAKDDAVVLDGSDDVVDAAGVALVAVAYVGMAAVEDGGGDGLTLNRPGGGDGGEGERLSPAGAEGEVMTSCPLPACPPRTPLPISPPPVPAVLKP